MRNSVERLRCASGPPEVQPPPSPKGGGERRLVSPFRCRVWTQHARPEEQLTEVACKSLIDSIAKNGQHQPALGRVVTDEPEYEVEIICGARRHAAALALGRDLLVDVRTITDTEAYVAMYEENALRKDDCPYIQGQIIRRAQLSGTCLSQEALARAFGLSHSKVSRLLMIAQLPSIVIAAFQSPLDIREHWGVELFKVWKNGDQERALIARARALTNRRQPSPPREVYEMLIAASGEMRIRSRRHRSIPVSGNNGAVLFRERDQSGNIMFIVPKAILGSERLDALRQAMVRALEIRAAETTANQSAQSPG